MYAHPSVWPSAVQLMYCRQTGFCAKDMKMCGEIDRYTSNGSDKTTVPRKLSYAWAINQQNSFTECNVNGLRLPKFLLHI